MNGWWYRASQDQKLAQVDAGIALGMGPLAIAIASGTDSAETIYGYAYHHGRKLEDDVALDVAIGSKPTRSRDRRAKLRDRQKAFIAGEAVDFWDGAA